MCAAASHPSNDSPLTDTSGPLQVKYPAGMDKEKGSLFDAVEDMDLDECVEKLVAINGA